MAKTIYLTIDDFPSATSRTLMDFLHVNGIPATFFCIGKELKSNMDTGAKAISLGFNLGNHSYSHPHFSSISMFRARREISKTHKLIEKLHSNAGSKEYKALFRFPYGDKGDGRAGHIFNKYPDRRSELMGKKIQSLLIKYGYQSILPADVAYSYYVNDLAPDADIHWTLDSMDWIIKHMGKRMDRWTLYKADIETRFFSQNPSDPRGSVTEQSYGMPFDGSGEIVLMHDHPDTLDVVIDLVTRLINEGAHFKDLATA